MLRNRHLEPVERQEIFLAATRLFEESAVEIGPAASISFMKIVITSLLAVTLLSATAMEASAQQSESRKSKRTPSIAELLKSDDVKPQQLQRAISLLLQTSSNQEDTLSQIYKLASSSMRKALAANEGASPKKLNAVAASISKAVTQALNQNISAQNSSPEVYAELASSLTKGAAAFQNRSEATGAARQTAVASQILSGIVTGGVQSSGSNALSFTIGVVASAAVNESKKLNPSSVIDSIVTSATSAGLSGQDFFNGSVKDLKTILVEVATTASQNPNKQNPVGSIQVNNPGVLYPVTDTVGA